MKITYDEQVDALYIQFSEGKVQSVEVEAGIVLDYGEEGVLHGIEILDASKRTHNLQTLLEATLVTFLQPVKA